MTSNDNSIEYNVEIMFSRHAKRRMKWRKLKEQEVLDTVKSPDRIEPSVHGRTNAYSKFGPKLSKVTYIEESGKIFIISAIDKNK